MGRRRYLHRVLSAAGRPNAELMNERTAVLLTWQRAELGTTTATAKGGRRFQKQSYSHDGPDIKLANKSFQVAIIDMLRDIKENTSSK